MLDYSQSWIVWPVSAGHRLVLHDRYIRLKFRICILLFCLWCEDLGRIPVYVLVFQLVRYTFCILAVSICS